MSGADVWIEKPKYDDAERVYYENAKKTSLTPLADEVAKARQRLQEVKGAMGDISSNAVQPADNIIKNLQFQHEKLEKTLFTVLKKLEDLELRVSAVEGSAVHTKTASVNLDEVCHIQSKEPEQAGDDEDVDLFGSDSDEEEEEAAAKVREERLAAYNAKKSKKPALIAKSNVILDVKPWDDETDMAVTESKVREITSDGLLWGAAKLVPLAYGIRKLQISCVVEDDKVSIDWLQEQIEAIEEYVQSVDIAAFNKI